jgi:cytochrome c biogenesis protein CcmG, thiol:disulfide interchange protein DsbE
MRLKLGAQIVALGVVVGLLALLVWKIINQETSSIPQQIANGEKPAAPHFKLPWLDRSGTLSLSSLRGKVVVLNFWASWCAPCRDEASDLERAWDRYRRHGVVVVGVDQLDVSSDARAFAKKYGMTYPLVRDGPGHIVAKYGLTGRPETFFVGRSGKLVEHIMGRISEQQLAEGIHVAMRS